MTERKLLIIVPTRSRPQNVAKVMRAWEETGAFDDGAELLFAIDMDDPKRNEYGRTFGHDPISTGSPVGMHESTEWRPMVHKLNIVASSMLYGRYFAIGFAGDDHLPRTRGWAGRYLMALAELGTGIVSCPDGYRRDDLPTQWAMTADIVRELGRMVPAPVEHLYCDNAVRDLGKAAGCWRWLDDVLIEHMHPVARDASGQRKAPDDEQYQRVNRKEQFARDKKAYTAWRDDTLASDVASLQYAALRVRHLCASGTAPYRPAGEA